MITDFFGNEITLDSIVVMPNAGSWDRYGAYAFYRVIRVNPKMIRIRRIRNTKKPYEATVYGEAVILASEEQLVMHVLRKKPKERA